MAKAVKLSDKLVNEAKKYAEVYSRSVPGQIEYWCKIGRIAEANPDLNYASIKEILLGLEEKTKGKLSEYQFTK